jgi:hypothetical protein
MDRHTAQAFVQLILGCILFTLGMCTDGMLSFLHIVNGMLLNSTSGPTVFVYCVFGTKNGFPTK